MAKKRSQKPKKQIILPIDHDYDDHGDLCDCEECMENNFEEIPEPSFELIIRDYVLRTMLFMGIVALSEEEGNLPPNLKMAKYHIDLLEILRKKTEKNLTDEEIEVFDEALEELHEMYAKLDSSPRIEPIS